jgi:hypothetical protein
VSRDNITLVLIGQQETTSSSLFNKVRLWFAHKP